MAILIVITLVLGSFYMLPKEANADFMDNLKSMAKDAIDNAGSKDKDADDEK